MTDRKVTKDSAQPTRAQRAQLSRLAILESARTEFGRNGYERATVRAIAAGAHIDPSMVMRYYGDKRSLFQLATGRHIALPSLADLPVRRRGRALAEYFIGVWNGPAADDNFRMLLFSASSDHEASGRIREVVSDQVLPIVREVAGEYGAETRAALIAASVLGVALLRLVVVSPEMTGMPDDQLAEVLGATIDRYLAVKLPGR